MATFVLVSGAWHAAWCWQRVTPLLDAGGHRVVAPDLVGMTDDGIDPASVTLAMWADQVAAVIADQDEPVVLVGHSRGGTVISEVAERVPERIARLVYLAAFLLPAGVRLIDVAARADPAPPADTIVVAADGLTTTVRPELVGPVFYSTTEPDWTTRATAQLRSEPMAGLATPLAVTAERFGRVPRAYVECLRDRAVPIALQRAMQADLPCDPVIALDTDHSPFFSAPDALAAALDRLA